MKSRKPSRELWESETWTTRSSLTASPTSLILEPSWNPTTMTWLEETHTANLLRTSASRLELRIMPNNMTQAMTLLSLVSEIKLEEEFNQWRRRWTLLILSIFKRKILMIPQPTFNLVSMLPFHRFQDTSLLLLNLSKMWTIFQKIKRFKLRLTRNDSFVYLYDI